MVWRVGGALGNIYRTLIEGVPLPQLTLNIQVCAPSIWSSIYDGLMN